MSVIRCVGRARHRDAVKAPVGRCYAERVRQVSEIAEYAGSRTYASDLSLYPPSGSFLFGDAEATELLMLDQKASMLRDNSSSALMCSIISSNAIQCHTMQPDSVKHTLERCLTASVRLFRYFRYLTDCMGALSKVSWDEKHL